MRARKARNWRNEESSMASKSAIEEPTGHRDGEASKAATTADCERENFQRTAGN